ncbi:MAG TPA: XRE family transcriptional regulator [Puia sp.]|nr:XRE family transcriptional regulator [Puia sp.]
MQFLIENIKNSGLSSQILAKRSGLDTDRINSIRRGESEPTMTEVRKLSKALKAPIEFLLSKGGRFPELSILFRKSYQKKSFQYKVDKIAYLIGNAFLILEGESFEAVLPEQLPRVENTYSNARLLAGKFREFYCDGDFIEPLLHLPRIIAEDFKWMLFVTDLGNDTDGASAVVNKIPFIFVASRFEPRMLFTLAHELAHIIAHHGSQEDFITIDSEIEVGRNRTKDEAFANAFASELLMPEEGVGFTLKSIRKSLNRSGDLSDMDLIYLSRIYGVSFDVAAKRCEDLRLLPSGGAISLSEEIRKDFGNAEKRAKGLNIKERPKPYFPKVSPILLDAAIRKIHVGKMSIGKVSEVLSIPMAEILKYKSNE